MVAHVPLAGRAPPWVGSATGARRERPADEREQIGDRLWSAYRSCPTPQLRDQLVEHYQPLAMAVLKRLRPGWDEDLEQVALLGLVKAVDRFDPTRGCRFTSFAVPTVAGEVRRYLRDHSRLVRCPRSLLDLRTAVIDKERELTARTGNVPSLSDVADALGVELERVLETMEIEETCQPYSLDGVLEPGQARLEEALGAIDPELERVEERIVWSQSLAELEPCYREIIRMRYYDSLTQQETACHLGVSQMQVSRLERRALDRLRALMEAPQSLGIVQAEDESQLSGALCRRNPGREGRTE